MCIYRLSLFSLVHHQVTIGAWVRPDAFASNTKTTDPPRYASMHADITFPAFSRLTSSSALSPWYIRFIFASNGGYGRERRRALPAICIDRRRDKPQSDQIGGAWGWSAICRGEEVCRWDRFVTDDDVFAFSLICTCVALVHLPTYYRAITTIVLIV